MAPSQSNCFLLSNVLKVYFQYATPAMIEEGNNPEVKEHKLQELVIDLQRAGSNDEPYMMNLSNVTISTDVL